MLPLPLFLLVVFSPPPPPSRSRPFSQAVGGMGRITPGRLEPPTRSDLVFADGRGASLAEIPPASARLGLASLCASVAGEGAEPVHNPGHCSWGAPFPRPFAALSPLFAPMALASRSALPLLLHARPDDCLVLPVTSRTSTSRTPALRSPSRTCSSSRNR